PAWQHRGEHAVGVEIRQQRAEIALVGSVAVHEQQQPLSVRARNRADHQIHISQLTGSVRNMRLGINLGYQDWGAGLSRAVDLAQRADALGFSSAWTAEAYGTDAVTPLTWLMAHTTRMHLGTGIMQMPARSPAMTAMTAVTLDAMSEGRFILGLGAS